ncbi:MAG TPA: hypothetical protein VF151_09515, partial [Gemmatimonadales bacterium]
DVAAAAILATLRGIREPSEAQQTAAMVEFLSGAPLQPGTVFRAMIDRRIQDFAPEGTGE